MDHTIEHWSQLLTVPGLAGDIARRARELWGHPSFWGPSELTRAIILRDCLYASRDRKCVRWFRGAGAPILTLIPIRPPASVPSVL